MSNARSAVSFAPALALEYRDGDSALHGLGAGWKLGGVLALSAAAIAARTPLALTLLGALGAAGYRLSGLGLRSLWRDTRCLLFQGLVVTALYALRDGPAQGVGPGLRTSAQLVVFFLPGMLLLRTTRLGDLMAALHRVLPRQWAFVVGASLRFVPLFAREIGEIGDAQRLRGAELSWRALLRRSGWRDLVHCLVTPLVVRGLQLADEAARSAEGRGLNPAGSAAGAPTECVGIRMRRIPAEEA